MYKKPQLLINKIAMSVLFMTIPSCTNVNTVDSCYYLIELPMPNALADTNFQRNISLSISDNYWSYETISSLPIRQNNKIAFETECTEDVLGNLKLKEASKVYLKNETTISLTSEKIYSEFYSISSGNAPLKRGASPSGQ